MKGLTTTKREDIGALIREARYRAGLSQEVIAERAGISVPHLSRCENGEVDIRLSTFVHMLEALDMSADEILKPDVSATRVIYNKTIDSLMSDCNQYETEAIIDIIKRLKGAMRVGRVL